MGNRDDCVVPATYRAWLSTSTTDAYCHVQGLSGKKATGCGGGPLPGGGPWYLRNGVSSFTGTLDALTGPERMILRPVMFDESGAEPTEVRRYWTGSSSDGTAAETCASWTSSSSGTTGRDGIPHGSAVLWSWHLFGASTCDSPRRLLCLEPGVSGPYSPFWVPAAIVFVTSASGSGNLSSWPQADGQHGIAAGDAICRAHARQAGLPGAESFVAWLSSSAVDASDRITVDGPFRRLDGQAIANSKADLIDGVASNSLHVDEERRHIPSSIFVWTGTAGGGTLLGTACQDWIAETPFTGYFGGAGMARGPEWTAWATQSCANLARLYCFQNQITQQLPLFADGFEIGSTARWSAHTGAR